MIKTLFNKDSLSVFVLGIICGSLYYGCIIKPRDEKLLGIAECMNDMHSRQEYMRCAGVKNEQH